MSSSDSDSSDDNLDGAVCEQLCQEFAGITGTDSALAMYFLQNKKWDLQVGWILLLVPFCRTLPARLQNPH
jgi:hypothetical protein